MRRTRYSWVAKCDKQFGSGVDPAPTCHEWNTRAHLNDFEGRVGPPVRPCGDPAVPQRCLRSGGSCRWGAGHRGVGTSRECVENARPRFGYADHPALWVTERGGRTKSVEINARFVAYRDALPKELVLGVSYGMRKGLAWMATITMGRLTGRVRSCTQLRSHYSVLQQARPKLLVDRRPGQR
jgi:hypothetical protein